MFKARPRSSPARPAASAWASRTRSPRSGANIVLNGFGDAGEIETIRAELDAEYGVKVRYDAADMRKPDAIEAMMGTRDGEFGGVDILVNNAGIQHVAPIDEFPVDEVGRDHRASTCPRRSTPIRLALPGMKAKQLGPHHQHRLGARAGRVPVQVGLRRGQARHRRPHEDGRARSRRARHHDERDLPRLRLDAAGRKADSRHGEGARHHRGAGHQRRAAARAADARSSSRSSEVAALAAFLASRRRGVDHRRDHPDRRRLDGAVIETTMTDGSAEQTQTLAPSSAATARATAGPRRHSRAGRARAAGRRRARRLPGRRLPGAARGRHRARLGDRHVDRRDQRAR